MISMCMHTFLLVVSIYMCSLNVCDSGSRKSVHCQSSDIVLKHISSPLSNIYSNGKISEQKYRTLKLLIVRIKYTYLLYTFPVLANKN